MTDEELAACSATIGAIYEEGPRAHDGSALIASALHDLRSALGTQSLLLSSTDRELRMSLERGTALRTAALSESTAIVRESLEHVTDLARLLSIVSVAGERRTLDTPTLFRLAASVLHTEARARIVMEIDDEVRSEVGGNTAVLLRVLAASMLAMACGDGDERLRCAAKAHEQNEEQVEIVVERKGALSLAKVRQLVEGTNEGGRAAVPWLRWAAREAGDVVRWTAENTRECATVRLVVDRARGLRL